jgi:hypothetical protein
MKHGLDTQGVIINDTYNTGVPDRGQRGTNARDAIRFHRYDNYESSL